MATIRWINSLGGDWSLSSNWSPGQVPGATDDVNFNALTTPYTATINFVQSANSVTLNTAGATVDLNNSLTIGTTLTLNAGTFNLNSLGTLVGGTIIGSGMVFNGGTLSGVARDDTLASDGSTGTLLGVAPASTYSGTITDGIVLSIPTAQNPTTVTSTGYITNNTANYDGDAVYGTSAAAWTLSNYGTINATAAYSHGIRLIAGGFVTNGLTGTIVGAAAGVEIENGAGTVTNLGTITATQAGGTGIWLQLGGSVVNGSFSTPSALIAAGADGVVTGTYTGGAIIGSDHGGLGTVTNYGTIIGPNVGVWLAQGGSLLNFGTILALGAYGDGVSAEHAEGIVSNAVTGLIDANNLGVWLRAGGTVANSGVIRGVNAGVYIEGAAGTLISDGTIESTDGTGVVLTGGGLVRNNVGGVIEGYDGGVALFGAAGTVLNYALISGTGSSSYPAGVFLEMGGTVVNGAGGATTATIESEYNAVWSRDAAGTVTNYGTIVGQGPGGNGVFLYQGGIVTNGAPGYTAALISGPGTGILIQNVAGTVVNYGTVLGTGVCGCSAGVYLGAGGSVTNHAGAVIEGLTGVSIKSAEGTVVNLGTITGTATGSGPGVYLGQGGTVTNGSVAVTDALIAGVHTAITVYNAAGTIINYGTLTASVSYTPAIYLHAGGRVTNFASGLIQGGGFGVLISGAGVVANLGTIDGIGDTGVRMDGGVAVVLNRASGPGVAAITGGQVGVALNAGGMVVNGYVGSTLAVIQGGFYGIRASYDTATVTNYGTVAGTAAAGVFLHAGGDVHNAAGASITSLNLGIGIYHGAGMVDNFGTVQAGGVAVYLAAGGNVTNQQGGAIEGADGIRIGPGTVVNLGTVTANGTSGFGILLGQGGSVTNGASGVPDASILATLGGVIVYNSAGTVNNFGTITASITFASAIFLQSGGSVSNQVSGLIGGGGQGILVDGAAGTVTNFGSIYGFTGTGVMLGAGGSVINGAGEAPDGVIAGYEFGVQLFNVAGTIVNYGTIDGGYGGIRAFAGANIANAGLVSGQFGVDLSGGQGIVSNSGLIRALYPTGIGVRFTGDDDTLFNAGTISGFGLAVAFGGGDDRLIIDPAAVFSGGVSGEGGTDTVELAAASGALAGFGTSFAEFEQIEVDAGASWQLTGTSPLAAGTTVINSGTLTFVGTLDNDGLFQIQAGAVLVFEDVVTGGGGIDFIAASGVLAIGGATMANTIFGFDPGDTIDLTEFAGGTSATLGVNNLLTVSNGGSTYTLQLDPLQDFSGAQFSVSDDGSGGTNVAIGSLVVSSGQTFFVSSGQSFTGINVLNGGTLIVLSGGTTISAVDSGTEIVSGGGLDVGATIGNLGAQNVFGTASATTVASGGTQNVELGGVVFGATVQLGGIQTVAAGGLVSGVVLEAGSGAAVGGIQLLSGTASGTTIEFQAVARVVQSGLDIGATVNSGGLHSVEAGGTAVSATILSGGAQTVEGTASATHVGEGGLQLVGSGGVAIGTVVDAAAGGGAIGDGGLEPDGGLDGALVVQSGGTAISAIVSGTEILSGGTDISGTVESGGVLVVSSGGLASGTLVHSGGLVVVSAGGVTIGAVVSNGGIQFLSGGTVSASAVFAGGLLNVSAGGIANGTTISGGIEVVFAGGLAFDAMILAGGFEVVSSGGVTSDTTIVGATLQLADGGSASGTIALDGVGDVLRIDGTTMPLAVIAGFDSDDAIDLRGVAFAGGGSATLGAGNLLTVHQGGATFDLQLDPLQNFSAQLFDLEDDGFGGTRLVVVDIVPAPTGLALSPASDSGVQGDNITNITTPIITGFGTAGFTVTLFDGATVVGTGTVAGDGTWAIATSALTLGVHDLTATQTDLFGVLSAASDPLALTIAGSPHVFQFLFTYGDGTDYYLGTVVDDGSFGYTIGQIIPSTLGRYDILSDLGATTLPVGTVSVNTYYHNGIGQASTTPVLTAAGLPSGTQGLGSEADFVLGLDGLNHPFSDEVKASFGETAAFGFIYTYADGSTFYTGTVADDGSFGTTPGTRAVFDDAGNLRGTYLIFAAGSSSRAPGTVILDRFITGNASFTATHAGLGAVDGLNGLGSEVGSINVSGSRLTFSNLVEPLITLSFPFVPFVPPPSDADIFAAEVNQVYADVLGRVPDPSGFATYTAALADGMTPIELRQILASSAEAQSRLNQLYQQVFGRDIDQSGLANYSAFLANGSSLAAVQLIIAQSAEAQNGINDIYQQLLDRDADGGGLTTYMAALASQTDPLSLRDVRDIVAHSSEAATDLAQLVLGTLGRQTFQAELIGMEDALTDGATQQTLQSQLLAFGTAGSYATLNDGFGNTLLTASPGTPTLFVFEDVTLGIDTLAGFDPSRDTIQLPQALVGDFATLQGNIVGLAGGSMVAIGDTQAIVINGVFPDQLGSGNFRIV